MVAPIVGAVVKSVAGALVKKGAAHTISYFAKRYGMESLTSDLITIAGRTKTMSGVVKNATSGTISARQFSYLKQQYTSITRQVRTINNLLDTYNTLTNPEKALKDRINKTKNSVISDWYAEIDGQLQVSLDRAEMRRVLEIATREFGAADPDFADKVNERYIKIEESNQEDVDRGARKTMMKPSEIMEQAVIQIKEARSNGTL